MSGMYVLLIAASYCSTFLLCISAAFFCIKRASEQAIDEIPIPPLCIEKSSIGISISISGGVFAWHVRFALNNALSGLGVLFFRGAGPGRLPVDR